MTDRFAQLRQGLSTARLPDLEIALSAFKPQQRHMTLNGRAFHFVAYEGRSENVARNQPSEPPMWYLMVEGRRFPVMPFVADQTLEQIDKLLARWLQKNALLG